MFIVAWILFVHLIACAVAKNLLFTEHFCNASKRDGYWGPRNQREEKKFEEIWTQNNRFRRNFTNKCQLEKVLSVLKSALNWWTFNFWYKAPNLYQNGRLLQRFDTGPNDGCARFPEFLKNFSERQILRRVCSVDFLAFTLILPIQTLLSVTPKLPVCARSGVKCGKFSKTSTSLMNFRAKQLDNITFNFGKRVEFYMEYFETKINI